MKTVKYTSEGATMHSCNCIGPQNGEPECPCVMQNVKIKDGRYILEKDLGEAPMKHEHELFDEGFINKEE